MWDSLLQVCVGPWVDVSLISSVNPTMVTRTIGLQLPSSVVLHNSTKFLMKALRILLNSIHMWADYMIPEAVETSWGGAALCELWHSQRPSALVICRLGAELCVHSATSRTCLHSSLVNNRFIIAAFLPQVKHNLCDGGPSMEAKATMLTRTAGMSFCLVSYLLIYISVSFRSTHPQICSRLFVPIVDSDRCPPGGHISGWSQWLVEVPQINVAYITNSWRYDKLNVWFYDFRFG